MKSPTVCLLLLYLGVVCNAEMKCCGGVNRISSKKCLNDTAPVVLNCQKYLIRANDEDEVITVENNKLVISGMEIEENRFCSSTLDESDEKIYLVCFDEDEVTEQLSFYPFLAFTSVFFIILTILVYYIVPGLLDLQGICIVRSIGGLGISFFILGLNQLSWGPGPITCHFLAYSTYVTFLFAFFWLNLLSFHIWRTTTKPKWLMFVKHWKIIYHAYGFLMPLAFLVFLLVGDQTDLPQFNHIRPGIAESSCWFKSLRLTFVYFYGPISALLIMNLCLYIWTIIVFWRQLGHCDVKKIKVLKYRFILCVKLFFIMGITWSFEVLSAVFEQYDVTPYVWVITDIINGVQGVSIFLILVVFRKKVVRGLADRKILCHRLPSSWKGAVDDECEDLEAEELSLSAVKA